MPDTDQPDISLVIPAYNEERRLPHTLQRLRAVMKRSHWSWEIVVAVEKSHDRTVQAAAEVVTESPNIRVLALPTHRGKGAAQRDGVAAARGKIIFLIDADLSVPAEAVLEYAAYLKAHPDVSVLIGSRHHPQSVIERKQGLLRIISGRVFNILVRALGLSHSHDTQCGFKAFRLDAVREIFARQQIDGFACDVEILRLTELLEYKWEEMPVRWTNSPESRVRIGRDSILMFLDLFRIKWRLRKDPLKGKINPD